MVVNDNAHCLNNRVALTFFASKLAPTGYAVYQLATGLGICNPRTTAGRARKRSSTRVTLGKF